LPVRLSPEEVVALDRSNPERLDGLGDLHGKLRGTPDPSRLFHCGAGRNSFHVDPFGHLMLCESLASFKYDLRQGSFAEGWDSYAASVLEMAASRRTRCHECTLHSMCGQCPAWSLMENGTLDEPVDYLCEITAARARSIGLPERPPGRETGEGLLPLLPSCGPACACGREESP
jgi:radical SAM protein with 4Fe4S-binding SPASM domain